MCLVVDFAGKKKWSDDELDNNECTMANDLAGGLATWKEHCWETDDRREEI